MDLTKTMKKIILQIAVLIVFVLTLISCGQKKQNPKYYKNFYSGEVLNQAEYEDFAKSLREKYFDPAKRFKMNFVFYKIDKLADSTIYNFKLDLRVGTEYVVNSSTSKIFEYINKKFPNKNLQTIKGESVQIGGIMNKPTLLNFWFTECAPCIAEMPVLNKLKEKYKNQVNFVSITWENRNDVVKFLKKA